MTGRKKNIIAYPKKTVEIYVGPKALLESLAYRLRIYSVEGMRRLLRYAFLDVLDAIPKVDTSLYDPEGLTKGCPVTDALMSEAIKSSSMPFSGMTLAAAAFISDSRNVEKMVKRMPAKDRRYLTAILRQGSLAFREAKEFYPDLRGNNISDHFIIAWGGPSEIRNISRLTWISDYNLEYMRFDIPGVLREVIAPLLIPELKNEKKPLDTVPKGLTIFCDEEGALHAFRQLDLIVEGRLFDFAKNKPSIADIKKMSAAMELKEFFKPDNPNKFTQLARGRIIAGILLKPFLPDKLAPLPASERIKHMFATNDEFYGLERQALLPQLSGVFSGYHGEGFDSSLHGYRKELIGLLRKNDAGDGKWNDFENVASHLRYVAPNFLSQRSEVSRFNLNIKQGDGSKDRITVNRADSFRYIDLPLLQASLFMLAALGLADIAYDEFIYDVASPFAGIRYWRITPLGHYILGDTTQYIEKADKRGRASFELDGRLLMIRMTGESEAMGGILAKFGHALSTTRYIVNEKTFLADCYNAGDVTEKIKLFRKFVSKEPPANWEKFFSTLSSNCTAFTHEKTAYKVLTVKADDTTLKKLLTTDKEIRKIVILAEGNRVLVPNKKYDDFVHLMRTRGYLL